jgi:hypothetical protein
MKIISKQVYKNAEEFHWLQGLRTPDPPFSLPQITVEILFKFPLNLIFRNKFYGYMDFKAFLFQIF